MTDSLSASNHPSVSLFRRLMAILYDSLLLVALYFVVGWIAFLLNGSQSIEGGTVASWLLFSAMIMISFLYFGWFWIHGGQTLSMKTWRMKLVKEGGMDWAGVARYFISAALSWALFGLGFLLALIHPQNKTLHDLLNKTRMLDLRK